MEIKMYFDTYEELSECFKKWQRRLGLSDWFIGLALVAPEDFKEGSAGESDVQWEHICGTIKILKKEFMPIDLLIKQPHEQILIHEMLHFKFVAFKDETLEEAYYELKKHQLIDELARALFLAEYNLQPNWFYEKDGE